MDTIGENDCNSRELARLLLGSVQRLLDLNQWNSFTRLQAIEDPFRFVDDVAKLADVLETEEANKGNFHIRITGVTPEGRDRKINCIKVLRGMFGWGLADAKVSMEALPGSGHQYEKTVPPFSCVSRAFVDQESLMESAEWKELQTGKQYFVFDVVRLPHGTTASKYFVGGVLPLNKKL